VDLKDLRATGTAGRITQADLDAYPRRPRPTAAPSRPARPAAPPVTGTERHDQQVLPVLGLRRRIAMQMQEAKRRIPHFSYVEEVDVTELEATRARSTPSGASAAA
jgi:2-oxoisovalerate dehydrogenase E2 component (dihydrolipoyl transacylase)